MNLNLAQMLLRSSSRPAAVPRLVQMAAQQAPAANSKTPFRIVRPQVAVNRGLNPRVMPTGDSGGIRFDDAGLFGGPATLPTNSSPPDPAIGPTPIPQGPQQGGSGNQNYNPAGPGLGGNISWPSGVLPGGNITSFGRNPLYGNAPPTDVATFWGQGLGNTPVEGRAVPNSPGMLPVAALKSAGGHNASYWVL